MGKDRTRHARKGRPIPVSYEEAVPGTERERAGTSGASQPRRGRDREAGAPALGPDAGRSLPPGQEAAEEANEGEGLSGRGREASGSLPGSVGGTTGVGGENAGLSSPGASAPSFPGISPGEAERLRHGRGS